MQRHDTSTQTYRFSTDIITQISKIAKKMKMSRNRYVTRAVERSVIVDSLLQGIDGIGVSKELFEQLISQADSNFLELKASEIARKNTSDRV